jgi:hypothetical protein
LALALGWAVNGTGVSIAALVQGRQGALALIDGFLAPDLTREFLGDVAAALVEAVQISLTGLLFSVESVDPAPVEALRLTGAGRATTAALAVIPQAAPGLASVLLYQRRRTASGQTSPGELVGLEHAAGCDQPFDEARAHPAGLVPQLFLVLAKGGVGRVRTYGGRDRLQRLARLADYDDRLGTV